MTEVERLEYVISADNSKAVTAFNETGKAYDQMDQKLSSSSSSQFGTNIASGANTAKGAIGNLSGAIDTLGNKLKGISAGQAFSAIESGASKAAKTMQGIGIAATAVGIPVGLLGKSSLDAFAQLESQITRDTALLGGGETEYQELLNLSKELGNTTPFNVTEIASGIESLAAAGYNLDQIKASMGTVAEMSIAANEPLEAMSDILVNILSQFGGAASDAEHFSDVLAIGANESTASIADLGEALKYAGNMSGITNKSVEEFSAALTVMANNGIKGTMAGTGLVEIMGALANPKLPAQGALEAMGLTKDQVDPSKHSLDQILQTLHDAKPTLEQLYSVFGREGAPKIAPLISDDGLAKYKEIMNKMVNEAAGANKTMANKQRDTLDYALSQISESYQKVQLSIGEGLKPLALDLNKWLQENGTTLTTFAENAVKGLTPFVNKILALSKSFMQWFNGLPSDMQSKIAGLTGLGTAMATIGGPLLLLGSLPVAAIGNVAGVLKGLFEIKGTSAIGTGVSTLVTSLKELSGVGVVKDFTQYLLPIGPAAAGAASEVGLLSGALATLGGPIGAGAVVAVAAGLAAYTTNFGDFRDNVNATLSSLGSAASNIATGDFEDAGKDCARAFSKGLESAWDLSVATVGALPEIDKAISEMKSGFDKASFEMSKGFTDQITSSIAGMTVNLPHLLFTEEGKAEITAAIKSAVANIDLSAEGTMAMRSFASAFTGLDAVLNPIVQGVLSSMQGSFNGFIKSLPDLPGLAQYKQYIKDTEADAEELKRKYGLNTQDTVKFDYSNYNYQHNSRESGSVQINTAEVSSAVTQGVKDGAGAIADAVKSSTPTGFDKFKLDKNSGLSSSQQFSDDALKTMWDSSQKLRDSYADASSAGDKAAGATDGATSATDTLITTLNQYTDSANSAASTSGKSYSTGGDTYDLFTEDPAAYVGQRLMQYANQAGETVDQYIAELQNEGKGLVETLSSWFAQEKAEGLGGKWDLSPWLSAAFDGLQHYLNPSIEAINSKATAAANGVMTFSDAVDKTGKTAANAAKTGGTTGLYNDYTQKQQEYLKNLKTAELKSDNIHCVFYGDTKVDTGSQGSASAFTSELASLSQRNKAYIEATRNSWGINSDSGVDTGQITAASSALAALTSSATALSPAIDPAVSGLGNLSSAIQNMATYAANAASQINAAISSANSIISQASAAVSRAGTMTFGQQFATGGEVKQTGPALVHQGEYVLNRNDVNDIKRSVQQPQGNQYLNIDLRGSTIDQNSAKDLPKMIARATRRSLARSGI